MPAYLGFTLNAENVGALTEGFSATIAGTTRKLAVDDLAITERLSAPSTADVFVRGFTPAEFADVRLYNGGVGGVCLFGGTAVQTEFEAVRLGDDPWWRLSCQDYTWLLNRYRRVRGTYSGIAINTTLRQVLASFSDGGFRVGYCPGTLGSVRDLTFEDASITDVLDQLADLCGGYWDVDADKRVHIFTDPAHLSTDGIALGAATNNFSALRVMRDGTDIATRVVVHGASTQVTTTTGSGAASLPVDECALFVGASSSAGAAFVNGSAIAYTGVSVSSGAGSLTGVTGLTAEAPQGAEVLVRAVAEDGTAQTDLATLIGGGVSGIAEVRVSEGRAQRDMAVDLAASLLARRKTTYKALSYATQDQVHTGAQQTVPGQTVSVNLTAPLAVTGTYRVQEVAISVTPGGTVSGGTLGFQRRVQLAPYFRALNVARYLARTA